MEALILRRNYPVPVTFADLRRAALDGVLVPAFRRKAANLSGRLAHRASWYFGPKTKANIYRQWHADLRQATGASDDVYAVVDGREARVARATGGHGFEVVGDLGKFGRAAIDMLLTVADEQGYWERPHEVRIDFQPSIPTKMVIGKVVQRSLIEAEVRRGH